MDQITYLREELYTITDIMRDNIQKIMDQNITIEELDEKTLLLIDTSKEFQSRSTKLKRHLWWAKHKIPILIGSILTSTTLTTAAILLL